jgi:2-dehydro-3-deoxyphosphogluconate aldolase / (4S)-4-hydroxy-2-oxoglutarate aldolase
MSRTKSEVLSHIHANTLVPVLRATSKEDAFALSLAIADAGIEVLEITMTVPDAMHVIRRLRQERPHLLLGAGTVLDAETADRCIDQGAEFIVSPALDIPTIELCRRRSIAVMPGALTPTEIVTAWRSGADVIKIFPADSMGGAKYLRSLKAPLPQIEMIPTGGISLTTARDFLEAGAFALGIGADLVDPKAVAEGRTAHITQKGAEYLRIVRAFHEGR